MSSLEVLRNLVPAHLNAGSIVVLVLCAAVVVGLALNAFRNWNRRRTLRRYGRRAK